MSLGEANAQCDRININGSKPGYFEVISRESLKVLIFLEIKRKIAKRIKNGLVLVMK